MPAARPVASFVAGTRQPRPSFLWARRPAPERQVKVRRFRRDARTIRPPGESEGHEPRTIEAVALLIRACGVHMSKRCRRNLGLALDLLPWSVFAGLALWILWAAFIYAPPNLD